VRAPRRAAPQARTWAGSSPQEIAAGQINHALAFYVPYARCENLPGDTSGDPRLPSYTSDGVTSSLDTIPEAARVRLDPLYDESGLLPWQQTIARALKVYGAFIIDNGGRDIAAIDNSHSGYGPAYPWGTTT
jgi:hypothetical protein